MVKLADPSKIHYCLFAVHLRLLLKQKTRLYFDGSLAFLSTLTINHYMCNPGLTERLSKALSQRGAVKAEKRFA